MKNRASPPSGGKKWPVIFAGALAAFLLPAQETPAPPAVATNSPIRQIAPGIFAIGQVRLDQRRHVVTLPATVNQREFAVEYFLVTGYGKTHESVLRTDAEPYHLHLALLLLGAKGAGTNSFPEDHAKPLPGDKVTIEVSWKINGQETRRRAEELIFNLQTKSTMSRGDWIYNGSRIYEGTFLAQENGSLVSVMEDADALVNNPRPGRENEKIWQVNSNSLPPLNTPIEVTIRLVAGGEAAH